MMLTRPYGVNIGRSRHAGVVRTRGLVCHASILARWCLDARYGCKQEATSLLQEWVRDVGSKAGLTSSNTRLSSGALGVPESRLEMEVVFDSMADWERFLSRIPFQEHKAWTQRIQGMVVDGSPKWQVHRCVPLLQVSDQGSSSQVAVQSSTAVQPSIILPPPTSSSSSSSSFDQELLQQLARSSPSGELALPATPSAPADSSIPPSSSDSEAEGVMLDWKGEPMKLNPGDKLPFKFL